MKTLEIVLLFLILLFPMVDLVIEKFNFNNKNKESIKTILMLWSVTGFLFFSFSQGALSVKYSPIFPVTGWKAYLSISIFIALCIYIRYIISSIHKNKEVRAHILERFKEDDSVNEMLPDSRNEFLLFILLSVSAGICEELIYRWYLYNFIELQTNWMIAVIVSSFIFGIAHIYLGWRHVFKTSLIGVLLCGTYLFFESITVAIIIHILINVYSGTISYYAKKYDKPKP